MTSMISQLWQNIASGGDPRIQHLPLMQSPALVHLIVLAYVIFVKHVGPRLMQHRQPLILRQILLVYNLVMMLLNFGIFYAGGTFGWWNGYSLRCQPLDSSYTRNGIGMAYTAYAFMFSKVIELLDTVFFVLRKKETQITGLHVWHHSFMVLSYYWGIKYYPGGHGSFVGFINSFIHVIMYGYYFLAALGPQVQKHLWWKKYLTSLQMLQFMMIFVHSMQLLFTSCNVPNTIIAYTMFNTLVFLVLFRDFFVKAYQRTQHKSK